MARRQFIAGNWKMNKTPNETVELINALKEKVAGINEVDVLVCPPFTALPKAMDAAAGTDIDVGAQNVHWEESGAFTGEISAPMLTELGVNCAIVGHSERRQYFAETDETVNNRTKAALEGGLHPIVCVGESLEQREADQTTSVVKRQFENGLGNLSADEIQQLTIAYEPVWAIGTGKTATPDQAQEMHACLRSLLEENYGAGIADKVRILYGGSVKSKNAAELLSQQDIDGALVGGASLKPEEFEGIVAAARS